MPGRRICGLLGLLGCVVWYLLRGEWMAWMVLLTAGVLPWLSLLVSIRAIRGFRLSPMGPDTLEMGEKAELWLMGSCELPMPPFRGKILLRECFTGLCRAYKSADSLNCAHCGGITLSVEKARVCDYLGLFSFPVRNVEEMTVVIRPRPVVVAQLPEPDSLLARSWKAKPGGGYAENHELRPFRPGDTLNSVHWKLSAKAGSLMVREPVEPSRGLALLTLTLRGTPEELDRKLGRLLWTGEFLLEKGLDFEIRALTGEGILSLPVSETRGLFRALDTLLCSSPAPSGSLRDRSFAADWRFHIGGEA